MKLMEKERKIERRISSFYLRGVFLVFIFLFVYSLTVANVFAEELGLKYELDVPASTVYVTDFDGDGMNELIVGTSKVGKSDYVYIYRFQNGKYEELWNYSIPEDGRWGGVTSLTVGDTDNDGKHELIVSTGQPSDTGGDRKLRIFKKTNDSLDSLKVVFTYDIGQRTEPASIKVGDADNDGKNEIVVGLSWYGSKIIQLKYSDETGDYKVSRVEETGSDVKSIDIVDLDGDGKNEIVAGTSCWKDYDVRVLEYESSYKCVWRKSIGYTIATTGDVDGDGRLEILAVSGTHCGNVSTPRPRVWIFEYNKTRYKEVWNTSDFKTGGNFGQGSCNPVIGNLLDYSTNEFAFSMNINETHRNVYVYGFRDGEYKRLQTIPANPISLYIGDSDNNGRSELLVCDNLDRTLKIYELKIEAVKSNPEPAPTETQALREEEKQIVPGIPGFGFCYALMTFTVVLFLKRFRVRR